MFSLSHKPASTLIIQPVRHFQTTCIKLLVTNYLHRDIPANSTLCCPLPYRNMFVCPAVTRGNIFVWSKMKLFWAVTAQTDKFAPFKSFTNKNAEHFVAIFFTVGFFIFGLAHFSRSFISKRILNILSLGFSYFGSFIFGKDFFQHLSSLKKLFNILLLSIEDIYNVSLRINVL